MIKSKLISERKKKGYTQGQMADFIHISQSQYQRRERGEIKISEDEWGKLAKVLNVEVEDIKEEEIVQSIINNYDNSSGSYSPHINNNYNIPEFMLNGMEDYIKLLKREIETLKEQINNLSK